MTAAIRRFAIVAGALAVVCVASAAFAQARFVKATPAAGSEVGSVSEIRLEFNEGVDPRFSGLTLTAPHHVNVELGEPEVESGDPRVLVVPITNVLQPGPYTVSWLVVSFDDHPTQGEFSFAVKP
jgi:methionine-rich copper-binding protein CopC